MNEWHQSPSVGPAHGWHRRSAQAFCYRKAVRWLLLGGLAVPLGVVALFLHLRSLFDSNASGFQGVTVAILVGAIVCLAVGAGLILRGFLRSRAKGPFSD